MRRLRIQVSLRGKSGHAADTSEGPSLTRFGHCPADGLLGQLPADIGPRVEG